MPSHRISSLTRHQPCAGTCTPRSHSPGDGRGYGSRQTETLARPRPKSHFFSASQRTVTRLCSLSPAVLPVFPVWAVVGIVTAVVVGLSLLTIVVLAVLYRRRSSKRDYTG